VKSCTNCGDPVATTGMCTRCVRALATLRAEAGLDELTAKQRQRLALEHDVEAFIAANGVTQVPMGMSGLYGAPSAAAWTVSKKQLADPDAMAKVHGSLLKHRSKKARRQGAAGNASRWGVRPPA
jgi:hypothetical protein